MVRNESSMFMLEICDRFLPYQRQQSPSRSGPEVEFVQKVRKLFVAPARVETSFSAADEKLALDIYRRGISIKPITRSILLGCAWKYVFMLNTGSRTPIASPQYFADIVEEVERSAIGNGFARRCRGWNRNGYWPIQRLPDAQPCGAVFGCPTPTEQLPHIE